MRALLAVGVVAACVSVAGAADDPRTRAKARAAAGWLDVFDEETTFGWQAPPGATLAVKDGSLTLTAGKEPATASFLLPLPAFEFAADVAAGHVTVSAGAQLMLSGGGGGLVNLGDGGLSVGQTVITGTAAASDGLLTVMYQSGPIADWSKGRGVSTPGAAGPITLGLRAGAGRSATLRTLRVKPLATKPVFDSKTLAGWAQYKGDPKREKSQFSVTPAGELQVKDGPGDLRTTATYDDFMLQFRCKTNGTALNSGVFFRCIPDEYQNGYEAQIQNAFKDNDRTKPTDFGTGAIYRRVPARKVVSNDKEYFTFTVLAVGPRIATWVDGYPTVNWLDDRKADDNPRKGLRTKAGHLSIQGHDPTTDILFRDLRVAAVK